MENDPSLSRQVLDLIPGMVLSLSVTFELRGIKINFPEIACAVSFRLVIEVRRRWIAALSAGSHCSCPHSVTELDDRYKAVAARAVNLLRPFVRARAKRRQRAPNSRGEANGNA